MNRLVKTNSGIPILIPGNFNQKLFVLIYILLILEAITKKSLLVENTRIDYHFWGIIFFTHRKENFIHPVSKKQLLGLWKKLSGIV